MNWEVLLCNDPCEGHYVSVNIWSLTFTEFTEFEITEFLCSSLKLLNLYSVVLLCSSPYNVLMLKIT